MSEKPVNVVIPMGGLGSRFEKEGYLMPKPLINIAGRTMISWLLGNLKFKDGDSIHIALQKQVENKFKVSEILLSEFPSLDFHFTFLEGITRGAAETLYLVTSVMSEEQQNLPVISLDCDTLYFSDVLAQFRALGDEKGCSCYFKDEGNAPIFSYISFDDETKRITGIAEKVAISRNANTGAYGFGSAMQLNKYLVELLQKPMPAAGEFYTSAVIHTMVQNGHDFRALFVEDFECVGTPTQLAKFFQVLEKRPELIPEQVVLLNLDSVENLKGAKSVTDEEVKESLSENVISVLKEVQGSKVEVRFSLASGFSPAKGFSKFTFADAKQRAAFHRQGRLIAIGADIRKAIGIKDC